MQSSIFVSHYSPPRPDTEAPESFSLPITHSYLTRGTLYWSGSVFWSRSNTRPEFQPVKFTRPWAAPAHQLLLCGPLLAWLTVVFLSLSPGSSSSHSIQYRMNDVDPDMMNSILKGKRGARWVLINSCTRVVHGCRCVLTVFVGHAHCFTAKQGRRNVSVYCLQPWVRKFQSCGIHRLHPLSTAATNMKSSNRWHLPMQCKGFCDFESSNVVATFAWRC